MPKLRLLVFNLATDADHQVLGFTTQWLNALAPYCETLDVITMLQGRLALAPNIRVWSVGKEKGYSEARRALNFYAILARLLATQRYDACFSHMMPLFGAMGGALLKARGVPMVLWYTHRQNTRMLQLATGLAWRVVSAVPSSFPISTPKLRALGHGITIPNSIIEPPTTRNIVQVARLTPIKHQHILLEAANGLDCQVVMIGDTHDANDHAYKQRLLTQAKTLDVRFTGVLSPIQVQQEYQQARVAVNLSPIGLFDKAALEAMAYGIPTLVANPAFDSVLGEYAPVLRVSQPDAVTEIHERLKTILAWDDPTWQKVGLSLRANVVQQHSLPTLIGRLVNVLSTGEI
jgi:glycosyltransferase involved in cell wall biosynthesis